MAKIIRNFQAHSGEGIDSDSPLAGTLTGDGVGGARFGLRRGGPEGAAMTDTSAWLLSDKLSSAARTNLMNALFSPSQGIGISWVRIPMGSSDFSGQGQLRDRMLRRHRPAEHDQDLHPEHPQLDRFSR